MQRKYYDFPLKTINANALKVIACASMFADHIAKVFGLTEAAGGAGIAGLILSGILGRIAFPLFAFMLAEGFSHTKNVRRYLCRLFFLAVISEIPFDLAEEGRLFFPGHQNTVWTLLLGLVMLLVIDRIRKRASLDYRLAALCRFAVMIGFALVSQLLRFDYAFFGIICIGVMDMLRPRILPAGFWGIFCLNLDFQPDRIFGSITAFLALIPLALYNGEKGRLNLKYLFYIFYPAHLLLLGLLAHVLR